MPSVIVTGASRGLGLAIARRLKDAGYLVIAISRKETSHLLSVVQECKSDSAGSVHFVPFDLEQTEKIPEVLKTLRKQFGVIYGLVNNAGLGTDGVLPLMRNFQIEQLIRLNTLSPIILTKYAVRSMIADGGGRIVNIASIVASTGYSGLSVYAATKASLVGFTRSLAREVGRMGVNVNAVAPGFIETQMTQALSAEERERIIRRSALRRLVDVEDVAGAVEFLLSPGAKNITGTVLTVDAGNTA